MNLGILMSLFNQRYFRDKLSTICEFIPQVRLLHGGCRGHLISCMRQRLLELCVSGPVWQAMSQCCRQLHRIL